MWGGKQIIKTKTNSQQQKSDYSQPLRHVIEFTLPLMSHQRFAKEKYKMFASLKGNIKIYKSKLVSESKRSDSIKKKNQILQFFRIRVWKQNIGTLRLGKVKIYKNVIHWWYNFEDGIFYGKMGDKKKAKKKSKIWFTL